MRGDARERRRTNHDIVIRDADPCSAEFVLWPGDFPVQFGRLLEKIREQEGRQAGGRRRNPPDLPNRECAGKFS